MHFQIDFFLILFYRTEFHTTFQRALRRETGECAAAVGVSQTVTAHILLVMVSPHPLMRPTGLAMALPPANVIRPFLAPSGDTLVVVAARRMEATLLLTTLTCPQTEAGGSIPSPPLQMKCLAGAAVSESCLTTTFG